MPDLVRNQGGNQSIVWDAGAATERLDWLEKAG